MSEQLKDVQLQHCLTICMVPYASVYTCCLFAETTRSIWLKDCAGVMRTKAELEALNANSSEHSHSFLTESQRAALDAALAAKQTAPGALCLPASCLSLQATHYYTIMPVTPLYIISPCAYCHISHTHARLMSSRMAISSQPLPCL